MGYQINRRKVEMNQAHRMQQYIHEIPEALQKTLAENENLVREIASRVEENGIDKVIFTGMGSSYTAGVMALPLLINGSNRRCFVLPSTEFTLHHKDLVDPQSLVVAVSRSGERGWVVEALQHAKKAGAVGIALTGTKDSLLAQNAPVILETREGPEAAFTKTKSVICCAGLLMRLALELADEPYPRRRAKIDQFRGLPGQLSEVIQSVEPQVRALFPGILDRELVMVGGTGSNFGAALETALILQEAADVPTIGMDAGNLLHGPWGSRERNGLAALLVTARDLDLSRRTLELAGKLGWKRLCVAGPGIHLDAWCESTITIPVDLDLDFTALASLIPMQLLTFYWCLGKGMNPDAPSGMDHMLNAMLPEGRKEPD